MVFPGYEVSLLKAAAECILLWELRVEPLQQRSFYPLNITGTETKIHVVQESIRIGLLLLFIHKFINKFFVKLEDVAPLTDVKDDAGSE